MNDDLEVRIINYAAGERDEQIYMHKEWLHLVAQRQGSDDAVSVRSIALDDVLKDNGYLPDVLKIDVEGYELSVLRGLSQSIPALKPDLHLEIHPEMMGKIGESLEEVFELLKAADYNIFSMDSIQIHSLDEVPGGFKTVYCVHSKGSSEGNLPI